MKNDKLPILTLTHVPGTSQWILARDVNWFGLFTIPQGFRTDLASIPRIFWTFLPRDGIWLESAVAHDYCYRHRDHPALMKNGVCMTRKAADELFLESMKRYGVSAVARAVIYRGVRTFGRFYWQAQCTGE